MEWMLLPLKRYADFEGRSRRLEYWMFTLFMLLVMAVLLGLGLASGSPSDGAFPMSGFVLILFVLFCVGIIIPSIAVQVRRLHDQNMSGWWILLSLIPYLGGLIMLVLMLIPGNNGANRFGPDPKQPEGEALTEVFS